MKWPKIVPTFGKREWRLDIPINAGCNNCLGWGTIIQSEEDSGHLRTRTAPCPVCDGTGLVEIPRIELEENNG